MPPDERVQGRIELIKIIWDIRDGHKALNKIIDQLDGKAISPHPNDDGFKRIAEMLFHQQHFFPLKQLTLGLIRKPLAFARLVGDGVELRMWNSRLGSPSQSSFEDAMDN